MSIQKLILFSIISLSFGLVGCDTAPEPRFDVTLEPSQIAANNFVAPERAPTDAQPSPPPVRLNSATGQEMGQEATENPTATIPVAQAAESTTEPDTAENAEVAENAVAEADIADTADTQMPTASETVQTSEDDMPAADEMPAEETIQPTSIHESLTTRAENPTLALTAQIGECFVAGEPIPFSLSVLSLETVPIYFYRNGNWMMSINNSPPGPKLTPLEPSAREDFVEIAPNDIYERPEDDLGIWVLSLGPDALKYMTETGAGLPSGDYWITFLYTNTLDGLTQQFDGSYLIDRAAWQGTIVSSELEFRVAETC